MKALIEPRPLPIRLVPHADESLAGLVMRYADELRFHVPWRMLESLGRRQHVMTYTLLDPSGEGRELGMVLHLSPEELARMSLWHPDAAALSLRGFRVDMDMTDTFYRRVCPACLRDACYHRDAWLVAAMPACRIHGSRLLRDCPACGKGMKWGGAHVHRCTNAECWADLRDFDAPTVPAETMGGISGLLRMLDGEAHPSGLPFGGALKAVLELGLLRSGIRNARRLATIVNEKADDLPAILAKGWEAFTPWPDAYHAYLRELVEEAGPEGRRGGLKGAFGELFGQIRMGARKPWAAPLRTELATFAAGCPDLVVRGDVLRRGLWGSQVAVECISMTEAARAVGVSHWAMTAAAERRGLVRPGEGTTYLRMLSAAEVRSLAAATERNGEAVSQRTAASVLGVSLSTVVSLIEHGLLAEIPPGERVKQKCRMRMADLHSLLAAFEAAASGLPVVAEPGPDHRVIGRGGSKDGFGVVGIVRAVLDGTLRPVALWSGGQGLRRFLMPRYIRPGARVRPARARSSAPPGRGVGSA